MKYTEEMILHSSSGYCMPFEEQKGKEVEMLFGYGNQRKKTLTKQSSIMALISKPRIIYCLP